ncbi:MAG: class I SAM-dependent methyltransferase [Chloroflexota bacterium]|nr:class I SAM-dependent methyltransferase [Chloroflexota bacterium]
MDDLAQLLGSRARVLDLGCGAGVPATKLLAEKNFDVLGVDISAVQIERARQLVPRANFEQADMATWEHEPGTFDAVVSFYALIHVPIQDQRNLLPKIRRWLHPGGYLLAIVGFERWTGIEDYLGAPMFWDHADRETYLGWLTEAALTPVWDRFVPEGSVGHTLVLAQAI